jgi:GST-like protein
MSDDYVPPKVWTWDKANGGAFASVNRPVAGPTHDKVLPVGKHPFQLYSLGTPNGQKVTILFEELLAAGVSEAEYDAWIIRISDGDQFSSGFVEVNPNSKIPALVDRSGAQPLRIFESGAILMHLAEKFGLFLPSEPRARAEVLSWLFWQVGSAPFMGGGFGHFYHYAPMRIEYAIDRYAMETKRLFDVANRRLAEARFLGGAEYSIADIAAYTWMGNIYRGEAYGEAATFLSMHEYEHVGRWVAEIDARPGVRRGRLVNSAKGLTERHDASDFAALDPELLGGIVKGY